MIARRPHGPIAKKLTGKVHRPRLSPADIEKLESAQQESDAGEQAWGERHAVTDPQPRINGRSRNSEVARPARARTGGGKPAIRFSRRQLLLAIVIAAASDALCAFVVFAPPAVWAVDVLTAMLLFAVLGWSWLLLPGLVLEAIPGLGVIPFWLLVVGAIFLWGTARPKLK